MPTIDYDAEHERRKAAAIERGRIKLREKAEAAGNFSEGVCFY